MNERIRELMAQAGFDPASIERMGAMPNAEKFAELIVRECAKQCDKYDPHPDVWSDYTEYAEARVARGCAADIKKHFGIEE